MSLIKEKNKLMDAISILHKTYGGFEGIPEKSCSYFKKYKECRHLKEEISEYNSEEMSDLKEALAELWCEEREIRQQVIPIILVAYNKTKEVVGNYLCEIDLNNYMM